MQNTGQDIVCAAVSVLIINTCNSIEALLQTISLSVTTKSLKDDSNLRFTENPDMEAATT